MLILGFVIFLLKNSNPFSALEPVPSEGLGLNPILQDPALAIHPPLLYLGFVGCSIYFSAAMASMLANYRGKSFALSIKSWVLISWCFQTLGIIVGSIWAYYELGRAGMALGLAGLFLEAHPDPDRARCDGPSALPLDKLEPFLRQMQAIDDVVKQQPELIVE